MAKRFHSDRILFVTTLAMLAFGLVMVFSASAVLSNEQFGSAYNFLVRQLAWAAAGIMAMLLVMRLDYHRYRQPAFIFLMLSLTLALLVAVLFFDASHSTHRWFRLGIFSFQPSELAKPVLILFLAWFLEMRSESINDPVHTLLPAGMVVGAVVGLVLRGPDLGTAAAIVLTAGGLFFLAGLRLRYLAGLAVAAVPVLYLLIFRVPYRRNRVLGFMDPFSDPQGKGFQLIQSLIAVGTGGMTGMGLMEGRQKLFYLPAPHTDFIYAVVAEELGLIGAIAVIAGFGVLMWRGLRASLRAPDLFGRFLAAGLTMMIVGQALINISVVLGMMPTKGIPLPFISYGGSSLLFNLVAMGLLLNVSQHAE